MADIQTRPVRAKVRYKKFASLADNWYMAITIDPNQVKITNTREIERADGADVSTTIENDKSSRERFTHRGYYLRGKATDKSRRFQYTRTTLDQLFVEGITKNGDAFVLVDQPGPHASNLDRIAAAINDQTSEINITGKDIVATDVDAAAGTPILVTGHPKSAIVQDEGIYVIIPVS